MILEGEDNPLRHSTRNFLLIVSIESRYSIFFLFHSSICFQSRCLFYPASYANCIAVAATDASDARASWSNYGDWVDVAAPGSSIFSTLRENAYGYKSGTSMASPHVAGLAALVFTITSDSNGNGRRNDEVRGRIEANCDNIGVAGIGSGRINALKAVSGATAAPGSIAGTVRDAASATPLSGAMVSDGTRTALTDASGAYTIASVPVGSYTVTASADGYSSASATVAVVSGTTSAANFAVAQVAPPTAGSISGMVSDAADGMPLSGAAVSDGTRTALTDGSGRYTIADVPPGSYTVTASATGYSSASATVTVVSGETSVADFSLTKVPPPPPKPMWVNSIAFSVRGKNLCIDVKVVGDDGAVAGANLALQVAWSGGRTWSLAGTTDSLGVARLTVAKAPSGDYTATVTKLEANGYTWDAAKGVTSAGYTLNGSTKPGTRG